MNWAERQKERGVRLELSPHPDRNCWKKFRDGKHHYLHFPITKEGYEAALLEWSKIVARLDGERPHAQTFFRHRDLFRLVLNWYDHFGVPDTEAKLSKQVEQFLAWLDEQLEEPELPVHIPFMAFVPSHREFGTEFLAKYTLFGTEMYKLPDKWRERIRQLDESPKSTKKPQTIQFWLDQYMHRAIARSRTATTIGTARDRLNKVRKFSHFADTSKHVSTIKAETLDQYHEHLDRMDLEQVSKEGYFNAFRMFVRWASKQDNCDLVAPANLDSREFGFREKKGTGRKRLEKKKLLWQPDDFAIVLKKVPQPFRCYCVLMLNCGFRSGDISHLRKEDMDLDAGRITIQREKLNQQDTAPVVSYPLWPKTIELIREVESDDKVFVFRNTRGGPLVVQKEKGDGITSYDLLSTTWYRNAEEWGLDAKRLDFIRKTGSTAIERSHRGFETLYLGESLRTTASIHYSFNDGEPYPELDEAISELGVEFGLLKGSKKRQLMVSVDVLTSLQAKAKNMGLTIEQLLSQT